MKSFSFEIKNELITKKINKKQAVSFVDGIIYSSYKKGEETKILFKDELIFDKVKDILKTSGKDFLTKNKAFIFPKNNSKTMIISDPQLFFAGVFVSSGSMSSLESSSYHLELKIKSIELAKIMVEKLATHELFFSILDKNDYAILYMKKNEQISEFLKAIGSQDSFFKFFDAIIIRDHKNQITRIGNLDVYNQLKLVDSHALFLDNYDFVVKHKLLGKFKDDEITFYKFKIEHSYLPLSQISDELFKVHNIVKTKSGLNHWLIKIRNIAEDYEYRLSVKNKNK